MPYLVIGSDNREYGPVDLAQIREWAGRGQVVAETIVVDTETGARFPASALEELRPLFQPRYVFEPGWTPPPAQAPHTPAQKRAPSALTAIAALAVIVVFIGGIGAAWLLASRPSSDYSSRGAPPPSGYAHWTYNTSQRGHDGVIDTEGVMIVFQGVTIYTVSSGPVQLDGPGQSSVPGGDVSVAYADGVASITARGVTVHIEDRGATLVFGGHRFDLRGGKKTIIVRPNGSATLVGGPQVRRAGAH